MVCTESTSISNTLRTGIRSPAMASKGAAQAGYSGSVGNNSLAVPVSLKPFCTSTSTKLRHTCGCRAMLRTVMGEAMLATTTCRSSAKLSGHPDCYKIQLRTVGYRLVYEVRDAQVLVIVIVIVIAVAKRDRHAFYRAAAQR